MQGKNAGGKGAEVWALPTPSPETRSPQGPGQRPAGLANSPGTCMRALLHLRSFGSSEGQLALGRGKGGPSPKVSERAGHPLPRMPSGAREALGLASLSELPGGPMWLWPQLMYRGAWGMCAALRKGSVGSPVSGLLRSTLHPAPHSCSRTSA